MYMCFEKKRGRTQCRPRGRMQKGYKPGYVADTLEGVVCRLSFILTVCRQTAPAPKRRAAYPPAMDEQPLAAGVFGLATHRMCGMPCRHGIRWALTPPFHPYPCPLCEEDAGGRFLSHFPRRRRRLVVGKYGALRCPDFPLHAPGMKRQTSLLLYVYTRFETE